MKEAQAIGRFLRLRHLPPQASEPRSHVITPLFKRNTLPGVLYGTERSGSQFLPSFKLTFLSFNYVIIIT